jgi:hypothetical protein
LLDKGGETCGDLGVFFFYELALQYSKARKALWTRLTVGSPPGNGNSMAFNQGTIQANSFKPLKSCIVFTASLAAGSTAYTSRASASGPTAAGLPT